MKKFLNFSVFGAAVALLGSLLIFADEHPDSVFSSYERRLVGKELLSVSVEDGAIELLFPVFFSSSPAGIVQRTLVGGAGIEKFVHTHVLDPTTGTGRARLEDDRFGWWIESELSMGLPVQDLKSLMKQFDCMGECGPTPIEIRTVNGVVFTGELPHPGSKAEFERVWSAVEKSGGCERLMEEVPLELIPTMALLSTLPSSPGSVAGWNSVVDLIGYCAPDRLRVDLPQTSEWRIEREGMAVGLAVTDPELLEFVSHFQSVDTVEPLSYPEIARLLDVPEKDLRTVGR